MLLYDDEEESSAASSFLSSSSAVIDEQIFYPEAQPYSKESEIEMQHDQQN